MTPPHRDGASDTGVLRRRDRNSSHCGVDRYGSSGKPDEPILVAVVFLVGAAVLLGGALVNRRESRKLTAQRAEQYSRFLWFVRLAQNRLRYR